MSPSQEVMNIAFGFPEFHNYHGDCYASYGILRIIVPPHPKQLFPTTPLSRYSHMCQSTNIKEYHSGLRNLFLFITTTFKYAALQTFHYKQLEDVLTYLFRVENSHQKQEITSRL